MEGSKYSIHALYRDGEPSYRTFDSPSSSSGGILDPALQQHLSSNHCDRPPGANTETNQYNVHWDCLGGLLLEHSWENGAYYGPSWINHGAMYFQQDNEFSDTIARSSTQTPLISPSYSEHQIEPLRDFQQRPEQINRLCESFVGTAHGNSTNYALSGSPQILSPFSAPFLPPDGPSASLTPESSQSPDVAASSFSASLHDDSDEDDKENTEPYAKLIYRALLSAPNHCMVLKDIYKWFEKYTTKTRNSKSKGWQNSIRHNLSMNGVSFWR